MPTDRTALGPELNPGAVPFFKPAEKFHPVGLVLRVTIGLPGPDEAEIGLEAAVSRGVVALSTKHARWKPDMVDAVLLERCLGSSVGSEHVMELEPWLLGQLVGAGQAPEPIEMERCGGKHVVESIDGGPGFILVPLMREAPR